MTERVWRGYLLLATSAAAAYPFLPMWRGDLFFDSFGAVSVGAVLYGIRLNRPAYRRPWYLFAAGQALFVAGDVVFSVYDRVLHHTPFPSVADGLYLAGYPMLALALLLLVRRRRPGQDWPSLLDATVVTVGLGSISWAVLMAPYVRDPSLSVPGLTISLAYPLADVLLLAVAARLLLGGGTAGGSLPRVLLASGLVALLVTDALYGWLNVNGAYASGNTVDIGWMASYALIGGAALHPSMACLAERAPVASGRFSVWRLALLAVALAVVPIGLAVEAVRGAVFDVAMFAGAGVLSIVVVLIRLGGVIRENERAILREAVLREAGSALVQAGDREAIYAAGVEAALSLPHDGPASALLALGSPDRLEVVALAGAGSTGSGLPELRLLPDEAQLSLAQGVSVDLPEALLSESDGPETTNVWPLMVRGRFCGVLAVQSSGGRRSPGGVGLGVLAAQVSLALESRELTEEVFERRGEQRFRSLVQNSSDLIMVVDPDLSVRYQTPSVQALLSYPEAELAGRGLDEVTHGEDVPRLRSLMADAVRTPQAAPGCELRLRRRNGGYAWFEVVASNLLADPNVAGIILTARDVTEHRELEGRLRRKAFEDGLTGLPNGELFRNRLEHALTRRNERARRSERALAVLYLDLDDFKSVNDGLGHAAGDALLIEAAGRIRATLRSGDTAARVGGDEFTVLLDELPDASDAAAFAARIVEVLSEPFGVGGVEIHCPASVGIAVAPTGATDGEQLIHHADLAVDEAKRMGKQCFVVFDPAMEAGVADRLERVSELRRALERGELTAHYQPIVDLQSGLVVGLEALVRWRHPERGLVPPGDFIPLAEQTGLIVPLGRWVLEEACAQARAWQKAMPTQPRLWVSVNLSVQQLRHPSLVDDVKNALRDSGIDPGDLVLELTESGIADDLEKMIAALGELRELGVRLAIDDFGTGYSALSYLRRLPVDILKIDKQFIADLGGQADQGELAATVIQLGRILHLDVIAEGIEQPEQVGRLQELGCRFGQGYLYAPPLESDKAGTLLAEQRRVRVAVA